MSAFPFRKIKTPGGPAAAAAASPDWELGPDASPMTPRNALNVSPRKSASSLVGRHRSAVDHDEIDLPDAETEYVFYQCRYVFKKFHSIRFVLKYEANVSILMESFS